jgi:tRNA threonylcarbamoyladenosine biosynthesis protein TsaB
MFKESLILAVETSSRIGSVAVAFGSGLVSEIRFSEPLMHSAEIFPAIKELLARADRKPNQIDQIYISNGPGSFTGLRIAVTLAKTMHLANAAKVVTVDTLDIIAANVIPLTSGSSRPASDDRVLPTDCERIAVIIDAKRGQFFIAVYECRTDGTRGKQGDAIWKKVVPDSLMSISEFLDRFVDPRKPIWLLGDGLVYYKEKFRADGVSFLDEEHWSPQANKVHLLGLQMALNGQFTDPLTLIPNYLRQPDVTIKSNP